MHLPAPLALVLLTVAAVSQSKPVDIWTHARNGKIAAVRKLLDADPKLLDARDSDQRTPLHLATRYGRRDIVELLLERGAAPDLKAYNRFTPLHMAIMFDRQEILERLLELDVDVNAKTAFDRAPIDLAIERKREPMRKLLLEHGASYGLYAAACRGDARRIRELFQGKHGDVTRAMALQAIRRGHAEAAALLAPHVVETAPINLEIREPLLFDATAHVAVVKALVAAGQDPAERNDKFQSMRTTRDSTVLHVAASKDHLDTMRYLLTLDAFADRDPPNMLGRTPMHCAAGNGRLRALQLLDQNGADLDGKDMHGRTVVHHAAEGGYPEVLQWLVSRGVVLHTPDRAGRTPLQLATKGIHPTEKRVKQRLEAAWVLVRHGVPVDIGSAAVVGDTLGAKAALEKDPELIRRKGLLVRAMSFGNRDIVVLLLDAGTEVDLRDDRKMTLLHWAAMWGQPECARLLLDRGADVDAVCKFGQTALHRAVQGDDAAIVGMLLQAGAKRGVKDEDGRAAVDYVNQYTSKETRALLGL